MIPRRHRRHDESEPLLPLINVVFLLLIFFMLLANLSVYVPFPVEPPDAATAAEGRAGITVALSSDGRIALNGSEIDGSDLAAALPTVRGAEAGAVWLHADRDTDSDRVIEVMERLRTAGVTEVRLITKR